MLRHVILVVEGDDIMKNNNEFLLPKVDLIFKLLFGDERNSNILKSFLMAVLRLPQEDYDVLSIVDPHLLREYEGDKLGILDVKVKTRTGKIIDIEIQVNPSPIMCQRVIYYTSKMVTEQIGSSEDYGRIKKVISIIITDYEFIENSPNYHHLFTLYDTKNNVEFTDIIEVNTLELGKLPQTEDGSALWDWMKFLSSKSKEDFDMVAEKNPQIKSAVGVLAQLSSDERTRMLYESRMKMEGDIYARIKFASDSRAISMAKEMHSNNESIEKIML